MERKRRNRGIMAVWAVLLCFALSGCANAVEDGVESLKAADYAAAREKFQEAVDDGRDLGEAYRGLGLCSWEDQDYEQAAEYFGLALDNGAQETATVYNMLGICAMQAGDPAKAAYYFEEGQNFPDASLELLKEMSFNLVSACEQAGDYAAAKEKLEIYVSLYPDDVRAAKELEFWDTQLPQKQEEQQ